MSALSSHDLSDAEREKITEIVSQLLVKTVKKTTKNHVIEKSLKNKVTSLLGIFVLLLMPL